MKRTVIGIMLIGTLFISSGCAYFKCGAKAEKEIEELQVATYEVKKGDSLWKIADSVYGDPNKWKGIYEANRDTLPNPDSLKPGMVLVIPQD